MKHLSTITNRNEVFVNTKGYAWIQLKEMTGARHRVVVRKVSSKQFSNYSVDTVRIDNETYLIDSQITVSPTVGVSAPYFAN
ncbi:hypothetical protein 101136BS1_014 [Escherichia phage vB_EcoP-101136BS1]|nr:hypothetical protein Phage8_00010 [Escherichia phage vB_EcoP-U8]QZI78443.1 hypothetical protein 22664BS1_013 [Escherichia phage vB_EcoP-22664BS1]QZI79699.1 hypothetical protein 101118UKE1_014 [Escherichia phage vB_EcoP-101118UKE1]QZI79881.1 hypothetical protein 101136BS1_014 [Escherichia phage vB_EcoP-101136BS1]URY99434.1 hypothetical protein HC12_0001 [Escherichia phage HC12]